MKEDDAERRRILHRKRKRGGRKPDGRAGIPRRGKGQESIGLVQGLHSVPGTDSSLDQGSEVDALACSKSLRLLHLTMGGADDGRQGQTGTTGNRKFQGAGETTGEQRISKDIAAGDEGKALKTRILGVEVA